MLNNEKFLSKSLFSHLFINIVNIAFCIISFIILDFENNNLILFSFTLNLFSIRLNSSFCLFFNAYSLALDTSSINFSSVRDWLNGKEGGSLTI